MNDFFNYGFTVTKIQDCVLVRKNEGATLHKNRLTHGLVIMINGCNTYKFSDGTTIISKPNTIVYLPKESSYTVIKTIPGSCIAINFLIKSEQSFPPFSLEIRNIDKYLNDFNATLKAWGTKDNGYLNQCYKNLYSIICNLQNDAIVTTPYSPPKTKQLASTGLDYIIKNISNTDLSVESIANHLDVTPEYFRKIFKNIYGISPKKYIINRRIEKAKELISSNEFKINDIVNICGFSSFSYFSSEFKKITSFSPSDFKKKR